ncbi:sarcosine oxidase subunit gamma [Pseudonocardia kujensis]|uniref:sarcosine oxidase subunit gamma n=1 Tax=Pseudonocardia kujensis TaxID=1128675 RepID=UPI001E4CACD3|nr:sarcosine oxidase subunit gamma family protein [Pseudonocardia kujensis]MCE0762728.1 sarcosine oxidase subunit gamma [Pseudonocardia kujensis]
MSTETLRPTGALDGWAGRFAELPDSVALLAEPFHAMVDVRTADPAALEGLVGAPLPGPNAWTGGERVTAIRLGPDEWLLTSPFLAPPELEAAARAAGAAALPGARVAVADVSAQRTTVRLRGAHARDVLETGCAIDLHPRSFGAGSAAVTLLGQAGVVLLGLGPSDYRVLVRSSFAAYLAEWLLDAAREFR